jgi:hypothetical protein
MPGERPFFIEGQLVEVSTGYNIAYVKVPNGNVYNLHPDTPGIDFSKLKKSQIIELEVTTMLTRVLSARIIET